MFFRVWHREVFAFQVLFTLAGGSGFVVSSQLLQGCRLGNKSYKGQAGDTHSTSGVVELCRHRPPPPPHLSIKTSVTDVHNSIYANINILCA